MISKPWTGLDSPEGTEGVDRVTQLDKVAGFSSGKDFLAVVVLLGLLELTFSARNKAEV